MQRDIETPSRQYIYTFVWSKDWPAISELHLHGIDAIELRAISKHAISALVSSTHHDKIRPQRKLLASHQEVVTRIAKEWNSLPVSFGLIAESAEQIELLLEKHGEKLGEQLTRIAGKVELSLNLKWTHANVLAHFASHHPEIQAVRQSLQNRIVDRETQIEIGRMVERILKEERSRHADTMLQIIKPACCEMEIQPIKQEADVVRLACLVEKDKEQAMIDAVNLAATKFNEDFGFEYSGPWPPYSFVKLALTLD